MYQNASNHQINNLDNKLWYEIPHAPLCSSDNKYNYH